MSVYNETNGFNRKEAVLNIYRNWRSKELQERGAQKIYYPLLR